jgi:hypothetical protein
MLLKGFKLWLLHLHRRRFTIVLMSDILQHLLRSYSKHSNQPQSIRLLINYSNLNKPSTMTDQRQSFQCSFALPCVLSLISTFYWDPLLLLELKWTRHHTAASLTHSHNDVCDCNAATSTVASSKSYIKVRMVRHNKWMSHSRISWVCMSCFIPWQP